MSLLSCEQVIKSFDGGQVLKGVDLTVEAGEVLGLVGENGVGKSTLMSILAGDRRADGGRILLEGEAYAPADTDDARRRGIAIVRQKVELDRSQTVGQAIYREIPELADLPPDELAERAAGLLRRLGVPLDPTVTVGDLQPSEHGLVEAVRMVAEEAKIVILDEVGARFNGRETADLQYIAGVLAEQGRGVIYISHRLVEIKNVCHRIVVMSNGRASHEFDPDTVTADHIADAMLSRPYTEQRSRAGHVRDEVMLSVRDLHVPDHVEDIGFDLHVGEVIGVVGPRRSGIHEMIGLLVGERPGTIGELRVRGVEQHIEGPQDALAAGLAYFSDDDDELGLDANETIARTLLADGDRSQEDFATEVSALRSVIARIQQLEIRASGPHHQLATLSGGDRQKVALSRWMTQGHDVLILNQPCRGLDVGARREIYGVLADHTAAGRSALLITNDETELTEWCDRIAVIKQGRLMRLDPASEFDDEQIARAFSARAA